jgi:hypothetical protein
LKPARFNILTSLGPPMDEVLACLAPLIAEPEVL